MSSTKLDDSLMRLIDLEHLPDDAALDEDLALLADKIALIVAYPTT